MTKRVKFEVTVELPDGVTLAEMRQYIRDEVMAGSGGRSPEDPLFYLNRRSVLVNKGGVLPRNYRVGVDDK